MAAFAQVVSFSPLNDSTQYFGKCCCYRVVPPWDSSAVYKQIKLLYNALPFEKAVLYLLNS